MLDLMTIQSFKGPYTVNFEVDIANNPHILLYGHPAFIVDANIARIYAEPLHPILDHPSTIVIEAEEENKALQQIIPVIEHFVKLKIRRNHTLIAIGGGIIQDITCFIASTLLRGIEWKFVPTTLLAQADSCIGSKSSINLGSFKNILGTFNPPSEIFVDIAFLNTLEDREIRSGIGEILKVHVIDSIQSFDLISKDYDTLIMDRQVLLRYIQRALEVKKRFIEDDEFDKDIRLVFNYGHSFGHAIESATHFAIPHGVAVSLGMDMANRIAVQRGLMSEEHYHRMHAVLEKNYIDFIQINIPLDDVLSALMKDKKNTASSLILILPTGDNAKVKRVEVVPDDDFKSQCQEFFNSLKNEK